MGKKTKVRVAKDEKDFWAVVDALPKKITTLGELISTAFTLRYGRPLFPAETVLPDVIVEPKQ